MSPHLPYWLAAIYLPGISSRKFLSCLEFFSDIEELFQTTENEWHELGLKQKYIDALLQPASENVAADLKWAESSSHHLIAYSDDRYPALLKQISDPPLVLYVQGDPSVLSNRQIAMVGSRHASPQGLQTAAQFSRTFARAGIAITSGLAAGIDGAAHRGCLSVNGSTIGVAGTGLNHIYPASHKHLYSEIIEKKGAIISEFPLQTPPNAFNFPRRNRIIAGLSLGVIVVEAAIKSGSLITARLAMEEGREVFAIPGSIHQPLARGCHHLIKQGAKLVETAEDVLEELGALSKVVAATKTVALPPSDALSAQVWQQIDYEITPFDVILLRSGLTAGQLSSILLTLELQGYVQSIPGGYVKTITNE